MDNFDEICKIWCEFVRNVLLPTQIKEILEETTYDAQSNVSRNRKNDYRKIAKILKYRESYTGDADIEKVARKSFTNYEYNNWLEEQKDLLDTIYKAGNIKSHNIARRNKSISSAMEDFIGSFDVNTGVRDEYLAKIENIDQIVKPDPNVNKEEEEKDAPQVKSDSIEKMKMAEPIEKPISNTEENTYERKEFAVDEKEIKEIKFNKDKIISFLQKYGLNISSKIMDNYIGNTYLVAPDIADSLNVAIPDKFENMVWGSVTEEYFKSDLWWICRSDRYIYVFELPQSENFSIKDFKTTTKTGYCNNGYKKPYRKGNEILPGKKTTPQCPQVDIILDMQNDNFTEVLGSKHSDFHQYRRAKLDLNNKKLFIYPPKKVVTPEEYQRLRDAFMQGLSEEQRKAATTDAKEALIVAGAGCGKTHTLMGRVIHLYETGKIKSPDKLLWVVFNHKNRKEHEDKLSEKGYSVRSSQTFHSLGLDILRAAGINKESVNPESDPLSKVIELYTENSYKDEQDNKYNKTLKKLFKKVETQKETWIENLKKWAKFSVQVENSDVYKDFVSNAEQREYVKMLEQLNTSLDTQNYKYTDNDICKLRMLNYLVLNGYTCNDIDVDCKGKSIEVKCESNKKLYWDEYDLHNNLEKMKRSLGKKGSITKSELGEKINDAILRSRSYVFEKTAKLFIDLCKIYQETDFDKIEKEVAEKNPTSSDRVHTFFDLIKPIYDTYKEFLELEGIIDFNDMVNDATKVLNNELKNDKNRFQYDYILVDEYQDIAQDTFNLIKTLKERSNASIMCVGDDWQSIYSWKGSDLKFFNEFGENFESNEPQEFSVTKTYRYGQNLAGISGKFIRKNASQKDKTIISDKKETKIIPYRSEKGWQNLLDTIKEKYGTDKSIKVLLRYNKDAAITGKTYEKLKNELQQQFTNKENDVVTIHKAKGLQADIIIILNMIEGEFPSEKVSDPVLQYFSKYRSNDDYPYAEERRLFYVAMTRAKEACYLYLPPVGQESIFWNEIKDDPNIEHE